MGLPQAGGMCGFFMGKSCEPMDDDWGYPHDLGNRHFFDACDMLDVGEGKCDRHTEGHTWTWVPGRKSAKSKGPGIGREGLDETH